MGLEFGCEVQYGLVVPTLAGKQQPLGVQVVHDGDVVLAALQAGLVDAHDLHAFDALKKQNRSWLFHAAAAADGATVNPRSAARRFNAAMLRWRCCSS